MGENQEFGSLYQVLAGLLEQLGVRSGSALILWVDFHRRAPAALGNRTLMSEPREDTSGYFPLGQYLNHPTLAVFGAA